MPLLGAFHEMVEEDPESPFGRWGELGHHRGEVVGSVEGFDDYRFGSQIITPHLLDQFGVVVAFHQNPAGFGHLGFLVLDGDRA